MQICRHLFSFSNAENPPTRIPLKVFVVGIATFFLRLTFVLSVWLLVIPFITCWIWRLAFFTSFGGDAPIHHYLSSKLTILTDWLLGFLLSSSIAFISVKLLQGIRNHAETNRNPVVIAHGNGEDAQGIATAGQLIRRGAESVTARWEVLAQLEARIEWLFNGLDNADGAEGVPFGELVGMQGPVFRLVENAFTVSQLIPFYFNLCSL